MAASRSQAASLSTSKASAKAWSAPSTCANTITASSRLISVAGAGLHPLAVERVEAALDLELRARLGDVARQAVHERLRERLLHQDAHDREVVRVRRQRVGRHHPAALGGQLRRDVELVIAALARQPEGHQRELLVVLVA